MVRSCEACEKAMVDIVESCDDPKEPYFLCMACLHRLHARSLRPCEWYNLAKRHGWSQYFLHDDFYDEDGAAAQPEEAVANPSAFRAPSLADAAGSVHALLDFSITRWHLREDVILAWLALPRHDVMAGLSDRFAATANIPVRARILEICAAASRGYGEELVRYAWGEYPDRANLYSLAQASAACLPFREGFERVASTIATLEGTPKRDAAFCLSYFNSPAALDWLEKNIFEPVTESWGYLAAASQIDWSRVESWLSAGRPLSLVAIDALAAIADPKTPFLRALKPRLLRPPKLEQFRQALTNYRSRDRVPRVEQRIEGLLKYANSFTANS